MDDKSEFDEFEAAQALEERVKRVVEQWGESFETVARNARFDFGSDEIRITLWKKIKIVGKEVETLTMVEPSLDDLMKLDAVRGDMAQTRRVIVSACSVTDREAGQIGMRDMGLIGQLVKAFTAAAPATGLTF